MLDHNPANGGTFTFADANALGNLPYLTRAARRHDGRTALLYKRDIGYGQGPGQRSKTGSPTASTCGGRPPRALGVTKSAGADRSSRPATGAAATLEALPEASRTGGRRSASKPARSARRARSIPLPLVPGTRTRILPSGLAAAGEEAPAAVKQMVAAGNRLYGSRLPLRRRARHLAGHAAARLRLLLGGLLPAALGRGARHERAGLQRARGLRAGRARPLHHDLRQRRRTRSCTSPGCASTPSKTPPTTAGRTPASPAPRWRVSPTVPGWASWTVRHPPGL